MERVVEQKRDKKPYETPQLTNHGSVEELTGDVAISGFDSDGSTAP